MADKPAGLELNFTGGLTVAPDGQQWPMMAISCGPMNVQFALPADQAIALANGLPKMLNDLADQAKRANLGLVVGDTVSKEMSALTRSRK